MNHDFRPGNNLCRWALLVALAYFSISAQAQTPARFEYFTLPAGTKVLTTNIGGPSSAQSAAGQAIWNNAVGTDGGMPKIQGAGRFKTPSGSLVPVTVVSRLPPAAVAAAVGRAVAKVAGPIAVASALYTLYQELGYSRQPDGTILKPDPGICTLAPCYGYNFSSFLAPPIPFSTEFAACNGYVAAVNGWSASTQNLQYESSAPGSCTVRVYARSNNSYSGNSTIEIGKVSIPASPPGSMVTATNQEFLDAVAARSGWPSGSSIASVLKDSLENSPSPALETGPVTVTGPATSPGPRTVTNNTTNNTTTTQQTTHNHTYDGDKVTTTSTVNNTTINNTTGDTISSSTTINEGEKVEEEKKDECVDYPERVGCSELGQEPETPMPTKDENITYAPVAFRSDASCPPPLSIPVVLTGYSTTYVVPYDRLCAGAGWIRVYVLLAAGLIGAGIFVGGFKA